MKYLLAMIVAVLMITACNRNKATQNNKAMAIQKIENLAQAKYQKNFVLQPNESKDFILVLKERKINNSPFPTISFSVFKVATQELIHEDNVPGGEVTWQSDDVIIVKSLIGRPKKVHTNKAKPLYLFNVRTHTKS